MNSPYIKKKILKIFNQKFNKVRICLLKKMQRFVDHTFLYYGSPLHIGLYEFIKRLQMWLNNPQCGYREEQKFKICCWDNHQGESSCICLDCSLVFVHLHELSRNVHSFFVWFVEFNYGRGGDNCFYLALT